MYIMYMYYYVLYYVVYKYRIATAVLYYA